MGKILIVDDEQDILSILTTLLTTSGHEVVPALGGDVALKLMPEHDFDLMISDIRMSPVDGMQLLRAMHDHCPTTAVIMLTAYGQIETAVEAQELGAYDYVKKPFRGADLLETVSKALEYRKLNMSQADGLDV